MNSSEKMIRLMEEQLAFSKQQINDLSKQNHELLNQIEVLTEQVRQLTKMIYGSRTEKSKYQAPDGQYSLFDDDPSFNEAEHTDSQSTETVTYTVIRSKKKRSDST